MQFSETSLITNALPETATAGGAERVLFVLAKLAETATPASVQQLATLTALPVSTLYRQIALLKRWGFVVERNHLYSPGPVGLQLAWGFDHTSHLIQEAQADLRDLAAETGESVGLVVAVKHQVVCVDIVESLQPLRCSFTKGRGFPLSRGASAKSLLAFMPHQKRDLVRSTIAPDQVEMFPSSEELELICRQGYAVSDSEVDAGVWGVSVPVFQQPGQSVASVTLMAPSTRASGRSDAMISQAVATARRISRRLQSS